MTFQCLFMFSFYFAPQFFLFKFGVWFVRSGVGSPVCSSPELPGHSDMAGLRTTLFE